MNEENNLNNGVTIDETPDDNEINEQVDIEETTENFVELPSESSDTSKEKPKINKTKKRLIAIGSVVVALTLVVGSVFLIRRSVIRNKQVKEVIVQIDNLGDVTFDSDYGTSLKNIKDLIAQLDEKQTKKITNYNDYSEKQKYYDSVYLTQIRMSGTWAEMNLLEFDVEYLVGEFKSAWYNAIYKKYDEYNKGDYSDFNDALANCMLTNSEKISKLKRLKEGLDDSLSDISAPADNTPQSLKDSYNLLLETYGLFTSYYDLAVNPTGSYNSYTAQVGSISSQFSLKNNALEIRLKKVK